MAFAYRGALAEHGNRPAVGQHLLVKCAAAGQRRGSQGHPGRAAAVVGRGKPRRFQPILANATFIGPKKAETTWVHGSF